MMKSNNIDDISTTAYHWTGVVLLFISIFYTVVFDIIKLVPQSHGLCYIIPTLFFIIAIFCWLGIKIKTFRKIVDYTITFAVCLLGSDIHIKVGIAYLIPTVLSRYNLDKKHTIRISIWSIVLALGSILIRSISVSKFGYSFSEGILKTFLASTFALACEVTLILCLYVPFQKYNYKILTDRKTLLDEKDHALNDVLKFCNTAMAYHSKYLLIHNRSVEAITQRLLVSLKDDPKYKDQITPEFAQNLLFSVQFHDIGKIYIDAAILDKPGKLTDEEYALIKEHPLKGYELFQTLPIYVSTESFREVCGNVILEHHERLNGKGYPSHTKKISLEGQIVAVADVTDALLSWRCYKKPFNWDKFTEVLLDDDGLNQDFCKKIIENKDEIINIIDHNNIELKKLFKLSESDIIRQ